MRMSPATFEERMPVWTALADLFLDTEQIDSDIQRIAAALRDSPYGPEELDRILREEVSPAFAFSLRSVAGEWAGWSDGAVRDIMTRSLQRSGGRFAFLRCRVVPEKDWARIKSLLA